MLKVSAIPGKGRAVVATTAIAKGELIESAPAWKVSAKDRETIKATDVFEVTFVKREEYRENKLCPSYLVFGLASLCNHAFEPNTSIEWEVRDTGLWANLIARRNIQSGEELTQYYTNIDEYPNSSSFT